MSESNPKGVAYEKAAFTLCKIATFCLIFQKYALIIAAFGAAFFFLLADFNGKRDTRCIGKHPRLIALFWVVVGGVAVWLT